MLDKFFNPFKKPPAEDMAKEQLEECQRKLLIHEDASTYHNTMVNYYHTNILRLTEYLKKA